MSRADDSNGNKAEVLRLRLPAEPDDAAKLSQLIRRVNKADPTRADKEALQAAFEMFPVLAQQIGDLVKSVRERRIGSLSDTHLVAASIAKVIEDMECDLGYEKAPAASKLLIQEVVTCWLDLSAVQVRHATLVGGRHTMSEGTYWDQRLSRAQARYLRAVEALARVNRLYRVLPVQINVAAAGGQQINVASTQE